MNAPSTVINIFVLKIHSFENRAAVNIGQNFLLDRHNADKPGKAAIAARQAQNSDKKNIS
jgi:hypothetical protein